MPAPRKPQPPAADTSPALHPRNRHQGRYDFDALIAQCPELARFVVLNPYGKRSIDFADPAAVKAFNRALLYAYYSIAQWDIPPGYLCPPIPGRADYLHHLADLLATDNGKTILRGDQVRLLDVGTGANVIYPLLGHHEYGWHFVACDIDPTALASAQAIVAGNALDAAIELRRQAQPSAVFEGVIAPGERFAATLCNPPFHAGPDEALSGSRRKWKNLGKLDPSRKLPTLNFGGQSNELWCEGGERAFIARLAEESRAFATQVCWFSTLLSKAGNVPLLQGQLSKLGAVSVKVVEMGQGQKRSRFVAWSYLQKAERRAWWT